MELTTAQLDAVVIPIANVLEDAAEVDFWEARDELTWLLEFGTVDQWEEGVFKALGMAARQGYPPAELGDAMRAAAVGRGYISRDPGLMASLDQQS